MRKSKKRKKKQIREQNYSYSPEQMRFTELVEQYEQRDEWDLTPEEFARDSGIIKNTFLNAVMAHATVMAPEILRECLGFNPPDAAVHALCSTLERKHSADFESWLQNDERFYDALECVLGFLKLMIVGSEIQMTVWAEFAPAHLKEQMRIEAAEAREQHR